MTNANAALFDNLDDAIRSYAEAYATAWGIGCTDNPADYPVELQDAGLDLALAIERLRRVVA
jgi:hypothetical protein